jgi:hypothetical protein
MPASFRSFKGSDALGIDERIAGEPLQRRLFTGGSCVKGMASGGYSENARPAISPRN